MKKVSEQATQNTIGAEKPVNKDHLQAKFQVYYPDFLGH